MDLIADSQSSPEENTYVLVIVDCFSKWVELYQIKH